MKHVYNFHSGPLFSATSGQLMGTFWSGVHIEWHVGRGNGPEEQ
jgi:hypothetical protein